jgi:hypothetical protein
VFHVLRSSYKGNDTSTPKVNPEDNAGAYNWYLNGGFKKVVRSPTFPPHFSDAFAKEEILANYLNVGKKEKCLQWVRKLVKGTCRFSKLTIVPMIQSFCQMTSSKVMGQ